MKELLKSTMVQVCNIPEFNKASDIYFYDPESKKLVWASDDAIHLVEGTTYYIQKSGSDGFYQVEAKKLHQKAKSAKKGI